MKKIIALLIFLSILCTINAQTIVEGNNQFALDLLKRLYKNDLNVFFSPYSISTALFMTCAGTKKETEKQMLQVLHQEQNTAQYHKKYGEIGTSIENKKSVELNIANSIWPKKNFQLKPEYVKLLKNAYKVQVTECDFIGNAEAERLKINKWVEDKTKNKIQNLIKPGILDATTLVVLTNAIYFYGDWKIAFDPAFTKEEEFSKNDGSKIKTPFMNAIYSLDYASDDVFSMISIPYKNNEVSMIVLLPKDSTELNQAMNVLDIRRFDLLMMKLQNRKINLSLPKFKMDFECELQDTLINMGMPDAFGAKADFTGMANDSSLHISKVIHKAFIDVSEKGTEAAASTAVIVSRNGGGPISFRANRPFIFMIRDNASHQLLFIGIMNNPKE
jgi:serpin B